MEKQLKHRNTFRKPEDRGVRIDLRGVGDPESVLKMGCNTGATPTQWAQEAHTRPTKMAARLRRNAIVLSSSAREDLT